MTQRYPSCRKLPFVTMKHWIFWLWLCLLESNVRARSPWTMLPHWPVRSALISQASRSPRQQQKVHTQTIKVHRSNSNDHNISNHQPNAGKVLTFYEHMLCGAVSRSLAKTIFHPPNVAKTMLQISPTVTLGSLLQQPHVLLRGAGAQFCLSALQGAVTFAIVEETRHVMEQLWQRYVYKASPTQGSTAASLDFCSSVASTLAASIVSVPQMVLMDK